MLTKPTLLSPPIDPVARQVANTDDVAVPPFVTTDLGNAERLVARHGADLRFCASRGEWLVWTGQRWQQDDPHLTAVMRFAKVTARSIPAEADSLPDGVRRRAVREHALRSESAARLGAMIELAQSELSILVSPEALDVDPWLINCQNGTLDLRTGQLQAHRREDLLTRLAKVSFDTSATCPTWDSFLTRILPDSSVRDFFQRAIGYSLTADTSEQAVFLLYGTGSNGKSTLLETLRAVLGDYAADTPFTTFTAAKDPGPREDLARLAGKRLVTASEPERGIQLAIAVLKRLTGGDTLTARYLFGHLTEFMPVCKLFLSFNNRPEIAAQDHGTWRRLRLIHFLETIPDDQQDKHLTRRLLAEAPGILAWAVRGCLEWQARGLDVALAVTEATRQYREDSDPLGGFLLDRCRLGPREHCGLTDLYLAYVTYATENEAGRPMMNAKFRECLVERGLVQHRDKKARWWEGIGLAFDGRDQSDGLDRSPVGVTRADTVDGVADHSTNGRDANQAVSSSVGPMSPTAGIEPVPASCPGCGGRVEPRGVDPSSLGYPPGSRVWRCGNHRCGRIVYCPAGGAG